MCARVYEMCKLQLKKIEQKMGAFTKKQPTDFDALTLHVQCVLTTK
jgi:hypothetical protein